ncbi:hypothetical protein SAG0167_00770 [Streptococcus agalactiae MRI Z1-219]|nr:hypothetical protein SAG0167_00770 [Streptococcus agalactiae MRI Z1-219]
MKNDIQKEAKTIDLSINKIDLSVVALSRDNSKAHGH